MSLREEPPKPEPPIETAPATLPQAWIVVANPKQYSWEANFSKITSDGPPVEVNWTHARGALAQAYIKRSRPGDIVLAYLSSTKKRAIIGLAEVAQEPQERDGWWSVRIRLRQRFSKDIILAVLKLSLPELEKVRVERASYSSVAPDLWPMLRSLILAGNAALDPLLPQTLAGAGQPGITLKLEPLNFPAELLPNQRYAGDLRVTNTGQLGIMGGKVAPPVSITAEWYLKDAPQEVDARTSNIRGYWPSETLAPGQTREWRDLSFKPPSQPGEYEVRLVVTDPERGLGEVSPPILTEVLHPQAPVSLSKLRTRTQDLRRDIRDSDVMGIPAVAAIDAILTQALDALSRTDTPAAQKHIEDADARWKTWQDERTSRQEIENDLQMLTKEANRALPADLSIPFTTQVNALRERNNALAPLPELQATLNNLRALYNALRDEYNRISQALAGLDPMIAKNTLDVVIAGLTEIAGQPYQQETFEQAVTELEQIIKDAREDRYLYALKAEALNLPRSAPAGGTLSFKLRLKNTGQSAWDGRTPVMITDQFGPRSGTANSGGWTPTEGVPGDSHFDVEWQILIPDTPGKVVLSWQVEIPQYNLKAKTRIHSVQVTEQTAVTLKPEITAGPTQKESGAEKIEEAGKGAPEGPKATPPPLAGGQEPQVVGATIGGITVYNAPVEINYSQLGEYAGREPASQKITLSISPQSVALSYAGKEYLSPSTALLNDPELQDPFRFKPADYGRRLFDRLFTTAPFDNLHKPTRDGFTLARSQSEAGRLEIAIKSSLMPEHGFYSWEYLTDEYGEPLATFESSPFYRQLGGDPDRKYPDANPLKILFAICSPLELSGSPGQGVLGSPAAPPADSPVPASSAGGRLLPENPVRSAIRQLNPLDRRAEAGAIHDGMREARANGLAVYEILGGPEDASGVTWNAIQNKVKQEDFHVLHLLAHGIQNPISHQFNLVMETDDRHFSLVNSDMIDPKIADNTALRLVTLASCRSADPTIHLGREGQKSSQSFAERFLEIGIPAVIAMQDNMDIAAAQLLTRSFYEDLARLGRIDTALAAARRDLYTWQKDNRAWGIPVLLLKGGNPFLFYVDPNLPSRKNNPRPTTPEKMRDLKSYQERTGHKDPVQDRTLQEVERMVNAAGIGATPSFMISLQQNLDTRQPGKPEAGIPLAEPQATRDLARRYCRKLAISTAMLENYVKTYAETG